MMMENRRARCAGLTLLFLAACTQVLVVVCYERGVLVSSHYLAPLTFAFSGWALLNGRYEKRAELWLGACFCLWYVLTRMLMGDLYLKSSYPYLCNLCFAWMLALPAAHVLQDERQTGLQLFAWVYFAGFAALTWLSLPPALRGGTLRLPWLNTEIGLGASDRRLTIGLHPNGSAVMMLIALMLGVWLLIKHRKRLLLLPAAVLLAGLYIGIGLTVSRTVMIQTGCFLGGIAALCCLRLLPWKQLWKRLLAAVLAAAVLTLAVFVSFGWVARGAQTLHDRMQAGAESFPGVTGLNYEDYYVYPEYPNVGSLYEQGLVAQRDFLHDLTTLTGRTDIWRGVLQMMKEHPRMLLTGAPVSELEGLLMRYTAHTHAHNALLQTLCIMGLPALLAALLFTLRAAWCALRLILRPKAAFADQLLAVMLLVWLLGSVTESSLFVESFTPCNIAFFLTLGYAMEAERRLSLPA